MRTENLQFWNAPNLQSEKEKEKVWKQLQNEQSGVNEFW